MAIKTQVVVIGGGATGTGILRDLAMRGIDCILVEKKDFATGTSGRFHGLLHSGARYVVNDFSSAVECINENKILKEIAGHCIEDTGGIFIATQEDDPRYIDDWLDGCQRAGIKTAQASAAQLLEEEPLVTRRVKKAYLVPDAAIDGFSLAAANVLAAQKYGAQAKNYTEAVGFQLEDNKVRGVLVREAFSGKEDIIECQLVINAAGPWVGQVANLAEQKLSLSTDKGVLVIFNHRITQRVLNHLRPPSDGDIFVPHGNVTIFGTTSKSVVDPNDDEATKEEVLKLLAEGTRLVPQIQDLRIIRAFAGIRPLYHPNGGQGRKASRDFHLIDHSNQSGLEGFLTVTGGKLTTFRLMAQVTVDYVASLLGNDKPCLTHQEPMEPPITKANIEDQEYLCGCEKVTKEMLDKAVENKEFFTLGDVRRLTRLGMGTCQGTFCSLRAAGYYHQSKGLKVQEVNQLFKNHLEERWKGNLPVLWGNQAQEAELFRGIFLGLLSLERMDSDGL